MTTRTETIGRLGEKLARAYLEKQGVRILECNYKVRGGEIDLIGFRRGGLVFFEVKTRTSDRFGAPVDAITSEKLQHIEYAAKKYCKDHVSSGWLFVPYGVLFLPRRVRYQRVDGIEVYLHADGSYKQINRIEDMGYEIRQHAREYD